MTNKVTRDESRAIQIVLLFIPARRTVVVSHGKEFLRLVAVSQGAFAEESDRSNNLVKKSTYRKLFEHSELSQPTIFSQDPSVHLCPLSNKYQIRPL
jgi:hypothetical protein